MRQYQGMKSWLTCSHEHELTFNMMRDMKEASLSIESSTSLVDLWEKWMGKGVGMLIQFIPSSSQFYSFLPDAVVPGLGLQLWVLDAAMISKQETAPISLNFMPEFLRA